MVGTKFFNETEQEGFERLMASYTEQFAPNSFQRVNSTCEILDQKSSSLPTKLTIAPAPAPPERFLRASLFGYGRNYSSFFWRRSLQGESVNTVSYRMSYQSLSDNVSGYPMEFELFINDNLDRVTNDLNELGINVTGTDLAARFFTQTAQPTTSAQPSGLPTMVPTISLAPSIPPSHFPSLLPSSSPTALASAVPSTLPSPTPTESPPTANSGANTTIIVVVVVIVASFIMIGLFIFYRRRKQLQEQQFHATATSGLNTKHKRGDSLNQTPGPMEGSWNAAVGKPLAQKTMLQTQDSRAQYSPDGRGPLGEGLISPSESLVSNQSLLSAGNSMGGDSGDEADTTQNLQDEFDQYKDQNLEKMRAEVEGNLTGFDGMMSQALTKALMDDEEINVEPTELLWGGQGQQSGAEIEASALCEVTDWLKRNDSASLDRK